MRIIQFGEMYAGGLREYPRENAPSYSDSDREKSGNAGFKCGGRLHAAPLTNEFGQVQVKCSRKKPSWPSGRRNGIWVAGRPRAPLFLSLPPPSPPSSLFPISYVSLATACDSPLTNGSLRTILTTVHYPRLWFFGPWLPRRRDAFSRNAPARRRCVAQNAGRDRKPMESARTLERSGYCRGITTIVVRKYGGDFRKDISQDIYITLRH